MLFFLYITNNCPYCRKRVDKQEKRKEKTCMITYWEKVDTEL